MSLERQKRSLGTVHLIYGVFVGLGFLFIRSIVEIVTPLIEDAIADESVGASVTFSAVSDVLFVVFLFLFCVTVLPSIIGGIALMKNKKWGLALCAVSGILSLPSFPFGTGVGVFTIFVLIKNAQAS